MFQLINEVVVVDAFYPQRTTKQNKYWSRSELVFHLFPYQQYISMLVEKKFLFKYSHPFCQVIILILIGKKDIFE